MIFVNTTDKLQLITSSTAALDVFVDYVDMDNTTKAVTPGRQLTKISTATTTDIMAAPASGSTRKVKVVGINNTSATTANTVTAQYNANATLYQIDSWIVGASERVRFIEGAGWSPIDSSGRVKTPTAALPTGNSNTADVTANASATYLTGASLQIGGRIQAGSFFKWRFRVSKTAAGIVAPTIAIVFGTAGTTADTARVTHTGAAQTAATDSGMIELDANFRSVGATAVVQSSIRMDHTSADAAGLGTLRYLSANSASFDATAAGLIIGVVVTPGTSGVWTFQEVIVDAGNLIS